jgi:hypothetical protein
LVAAFAVFKWRFGSSGKLGGKKGGFIPVFWQRFAAYTEKVGLVI